MNTVNLLQKVVCIAELVIILIIISVNVDDSFSNNNGLSNAECWTKFRGQNSLAVISLVFCHFARNVLNMRSQSVDLECTIIAYIVILFQMKGIFTSNCHLCIYFLQCWCKLQQILYRPDDNLIYRSAEINRSRPCRSQII